MCAAALAGAHARTYTRAAANLAASARASPRSGNCHQHLNSGDLLQHPDGLRSGKKWLKTKKSGKLFGWFKRNVYFCGR